MASGGRGDLLGCQEGETIIEAPTNFHSETSYVFFDPFTFDKIEKSENVLYANT